MDRFSEQVVVVGALVALIGRDSKTLEAVALEFPGRIRFYVGDLLLDEDLLAVKARIARDFGGVDILVHSAGVFSMARIETASLEDFDLQYQCNVRAPFALTKLFLPLLLERQGQVVFINSTAGLNAGAGVSQYAATKHALKAVADSLRQEVNIQGVRVLSVYLGRTATPMQERVCRLEGKPYDPTVLIQPNDVAQTLVQTLALPRSAEIIDLTIRPMSK
jgi:NADP-dependent 3-hydroxy acid dehydrogenase YdfG